jgi:hypothetical protein
VQHSENLAKQQSLHEQGLHAESASAISTSSKIAPVNLEMNRNKGFDDTPHETCQGKVFVKNHKSARNILLLMH